MSSFLYGANVRANGIRQHYLRYGGKGPVLLLVPGITSPAIVWGFVGDALGADYDVYIVDVRGRGLSSSDPDLDYGLDACADDLNGFVAALGLENVTGIGHSMGARHLLRAQRRGMFSRLILVDPPVSGPGRRPYPAPLDLYLDSMALARRGAGVEDLRALTPGWTDEAIRLRAEWLHSCVEPAVRASFRGFHEDDIHQDIAALTVPALLIAAEHGGVILDDDLAEIQRLCPAMQSCRIRDAGHMIPWDNLPDFLTEVRKYMESAGSALPHRLS